MESNLSQGLLPLDQVVYKQRISAQCPSNIALIKYWGKYDDQLPLNPSLSFTLDKARTESVLQISESETRKIKVTLNGELKVDFAEKIDKYFTKLVSYGITALSRGTYHLLTKNTFPHSSGIASSASGFGALAEILVYWLYDSEHQTQELVSQLARLGSGSASRSMFAHLSQWGIDQNKKGNQQFAVAYKTLAEIHPMFTTYQDTILIVEENKKAVSSSQGHQLMNLHDYGKQRIERANRNLLQLNQSIQLGDLTEFIEIVESEALDLHAMMMTSHPNYILMEPQTLSIIKAVREYRNQMNIPLCFTLDAGANVHLLYPVKHCEEVLFFIERELKPFYSYYICDNVGLGSSVL